MKMYILLHENLPDEFAPVVSAHASLACYLKFQEDEDMKNWVNSVFKKVICKIDTATFEKMKTEEKCIVLTESALDNQEVALAFCPREEYSKAFKFFSKWKPS